MRSLCTALFMLLLVPWAAAAAQREPISLYGTFRWHQWQEQYAEQATGNPASLEEQGPLFGLGIVVPVALLPTPTSYGELMLRNRLELFGGQVRYHGHLQNVQTGTLTPYKTDVNYFALQELLDLGWRFPVASVVLEPFAGLGARWWLRSLQGGGGYNEYWFTLNSRFGGRIAWPLSSTITLAAVGGAQLPFYTTNTADGTTLKPDGQWSTFGELSFAHGHWEHALFYEGLRYRQSPVVHVSPTLALLQPPSQSDIIGYRLGYRF